MNPDPFEQQLQRRALPPLPAEWRAEILGAAATAREEQERAEMPARGVSWRHVRWGALAAVWIATATFNQLDPAEGNAPAPTLAYKDVLQAVEARTQLTTEVRATDHTPEIATPPAVRQRSGHHRGRRTVTSQFA